MDHHHSLFPPGEAHEKKLTPEEEQNLLAASRRRRERISNNEGPDWPVEIDKYLTRYVQDYEKTWKGLSETGRWNRTVRVMRLPYCGSEKEYRFIYRGSGTQHISVSTIHGEASNMRRYEELEKAGVFMHVRAPKVYYTKHVEDGGRGPKDTAAVLCEFFDGADNAEDQINQEEELSKDWINPKQGNRNGKSAYNPLKRANPSSSLYWSERKRRKTVRKHALILVQMKLIQKSTISGGADNPMYDHAGTFANMGPRATQGEMCHGSGFSSKSSFLNRGRAPEVADRRYRLGGYKNEGEMIIESIKRELAYWSMVNDRTYDQIRGYLLLMKSPKDIAYYCTRARITTYLSKLLEHLEVHHYYRRLHRFRDNENQFLGLFSLNHGDLVSGNNIMMSGDTMKYMIDFETTTFKPVAYDDDTITRTTYNKKGGWSPLSVGMANRPELLHHDFTAPLSLEHSWPFSGEIAPIADRYYRLTLFLQLDRFELGSRTQDPTLTSIDTYGDAEIFPNLLVSGRPYFTAAFNRFGPELNLEDFHYGDRYDTSMDDVPIPTTPYTPGLYYDSDDDPESDGPDALDTQPIYDRMRLQVYEMSRHDPIYSEKSQADARFAYPTREAHAARLKRRLLDSPFNRDWHHNMVHPLFRRFIDTKIQNAPMTWIPDPAHRPTDFADPSNPDQLVCWNVDGYILPEKEDEDEGEVPKAVTKYPVHNSAYWGVDPEEFPPEPRLMTEMTAHAPIDAEDIENARKFGGHEALRAAKRLDVGAQNDLPSTKKQSEPYEVGQGVDEGLRSEWRKEAWRERFGPRRDQAEEEEDEGEEGGEGEERE